ncbi:hypothetical protein HLB23_30120 [Nocardia uniformis]|uniref:Uncharacterized protein n=1 Tax=Nocardia uniformis TaxID=53432 RepID=A0A849C604_9NOCA|nr:hypothetical protein [Nocardia uniformis]NNH74062.1 hypothetical protein [Nocardia uniformis]
MYPSSPYSYGSPAFPTPALINTRPPKANPCTAVTAGALAVLGCFGHGFLAIFAGSVILAGGAQDDGTDPDGSAVVAALVIAPLSLCIAVGLIVGAVLLFSRVAAGRYAIIAVSVLALLPWLAVLVLGNPVIGGFGLLFPLATLGTAAWRTTGRWIREERVPYTV